MEPFIREESYKEYEKEIDEKFSKAETNCKHLLKHEYFGYLDDYFRCKLDANGRDCEGKCNLYEENKNEHIKDRVFLTVFIALIIVLPTFLNIKMGIW